MSKKKIAFFAPNLFGGGAERIISILSAHCSNRGLNVDLLLGNANGPYLRDVPTSTRIIDFGCTKVIFTLPKLVSYLREENPDVLFSSHMRCSTLALWAVKIARVDTDVIIRQPTMLQPEFQTSSLNTKLRQKLLLWSARKWARQVIVTSKAMAEEFISISKIAPDRVSIIHNPLPVAEILQASKHPLYHSWFDADQPPVVLAVGRLERVKDYQTLIKAFALVRKKIDTRLLILGEGPLRSELERLVRELDLEGQVEMPGFVQNPFQYMKLSRVFVMSSLWEGFPNSIIEAMACGANVVSTDCDGGAAEILEDGRWGRLVPVQDHKVMALSIYEALKSGELSDARQRVEHFAVDKIVDEYIRLFINGKS